MLYLDNAATTKLNPEVLTAMLDSLNTRRYKEDLKMINLNEIAFIDTDGFDYP